MRWFVLAMVFLLSVINYADKSVLGLAAEPIMSELNLNYDHFGLVGSSFFAAYAIGSIVLGTLTYRFNTKLLLIIVAVGWTISLCTAYIVDTFAGLITIRVLLGFFEGGTYGLCVAHVAKWFASENRGSAYAIMTSGTTVGTYLVAPILVFLISSFSWKFAFLVLGLSSLVWAIVFFFMRSQPKEPIQETVPTASSTEKAQFKDILKVYKNPYVIAIFVMLFVSMWINTWVLTWAPTYLTKIVGLEPGTMSVVFACMGIAGTVTAILMGKYTDVLFRKNKTLVKSYDKVLITILFVGAVAYAITTIIDAPIFACLFLAVGLIINTCLLPLGTTIQSLVVPKELVGSVSGISLSFVSMAGIIGPYVTGLLITLAGEDIRAGFNSGVLIVVALYLVSGIFLLFVSRRNATLAKKKDAVTPAMSVE